MGSDFLMQQTLDLKPTPWLVGLILFLPQMWLILFLHLFALCLAMAISIATNYLT